MKTLILSGDGINCEQETAAAFTLAGADPEIVHINALLENPTKLMDAGLLVLPGGFSFGDEVSSGKMLALKLRYRLGETLKDFLAKQRLILGICNGFQALVKLGFLPTVSADFEQQVTLTHNRQRRFINRWVRLKSTQIAGFNLPEPFDLPIRHGEGRLIVPPNLQATMAEHALFRYETDVNGSFDQIAGLSDTSGRIVGLMPHPEGFVRQHQHPDHLQSQAPAGLVFLKQVIQRAKS